MITPLIEARTIDLHCTELDDTPANRLLCQLANLAYELAALDENRRAQLATLTQRVADLEAQVAARAIAQEA